MKKNKGITLIALIITIIILIILTAITINNVIGTDLIGFATKAVENYTDAAKDEADKVDKLAGTLDNQGVGEDSKVRAGEIVTKTEKDNYTDAEGRTATIPAGFKVSTNAEEQNIESGLVIQDNDGNEFVWIPCYYETKPEGIADDVQEYKKHEYVNSKWPELKYIEYNWNDEATETADSYGNKSVSIYGGFYIGRYEAGWNETTVEKLKEGATKEEATEYVKTDKNSEKTKKDITDKKPVSKANTFAWNFISQPNAEEVSKIMYEGNTAVLSRLVDGTAWDTVSSWIEKSGIDVTDSISYGNYRINGSNYTGWYAEHVVSSQVKDKTGGVLGALYANKFKNDSIVLQGKRLTEEEWNTKKADIANDDDQTNVTNNYLDTLIEIPTGSYDGFKLKNIYDLAGNMWEWTTEVGNREKIEKKEEIEEPVTESTYLYTVLRGGSLDCNQPLCQRNSNSITKPTDFNVGFRVVLYIQ